MRPEWWRLFHMQGVELAINWQKLEISTVLYGMRRNSYWNQYFTARENPCYWSFLNWSEEISERCLDLHFTKWCRCWSRQDQSLYLSNLEGFPSILQTVNLGVKLWVCALRSTYQATYSHLRQSVGVTSKSNFQVITWLITWILWAKITNQRQGFAQRLSYYKFSKMYEKENWILLNP